MYFILSLILTGLFGYFLPQWMYEMSWNDLIAIKNGETVSSQVSQIIKNLGWSSQSAAELAYEKMQVCMWITIAVFIVLMIITNIIKKAISKK